MLLLLCLANAAASSEPLGVLGMGSNVVDKFYRLRGAGGMKDVMGQKGYFAATDDVVGGVTLNRPPSAGRAHMRRRVAKEGRIVEGLRQSRGARRTGNFVIESLNLIMGRP